MYERSLRNIVRGRKIFFFFFLEGKVDLEGFDGFMNPAKVSLILNLENRLETANSQLMTSVIPLPI